MEVINLSKDKGKVGASISLAEDIIFNVLARLPAKVLCWFRCVCKGWFWWAHKTTMEAINLGKGTSGAGVSLPEDIIFDVLARLPAKVLCRFRCVSKGWRALISGEAFIAAQKSRAAPVIVGVFSSQDMVSKFELRVMDMDGSILRVFKDVTMSLAPTRLDDLICVYRTWCAAMVIEPANGRVLAVDEFTDPNPNTPMSSFKLYGFGRAAPSGAYKLVRVQEPFDNHGHRLCEIATINGNCSEVTWRQRPVPPVSIYQYGDSKATINGILYFMASSTSQGQPRVAAFNLESEEWTETIDGPTMGPRKDRESLFYALAELKATLNMVQTVYYPHQDGYDMSMAIHIWLLIDSKKSIWVKQYMIQMPEILPQVQALNVLGDGRILLLNNKGECGPYILQFYDPSTEALTDFMEMPNEFDGDMAFYTGSFLY